MRYQNVSLEVLIKGRPITEYPHNGRIYVEGRANSSFEVKVTNHNPFKVEAVISVDGLSVTDGKEAGITSSGYVLEANESAVIPGWKLSAQQIAAFEFAGKGKSYAEHAAGSERNTGVIGVMVFKERYAPSRSFQVSSPSFGQISIPTHWTSTSSADNAYQDLIRTANLCTSDYDPNHMIKGVCLNAVSNTVAGDGGNGIGDMGWATGGVLGMASSGTIGINAMAMGSAQTMTSYNAAPQASAQAATSRSAMRDMYARNAQSKGADEAQRSRRVQATAAQAPEPVQQNLGTAFGRAQDFATTTVSFDRGDMIAMAVIYYNDARGLKALGIELSRKAKVVASQTPNAFPGLAGCAPPPGWRG